MNNPDHYKINGKDTMSTIIEIVKKNTEDAEEAVYLFNTLKYLVRYGDKNGLEDLIKAQDYLERLINYLKNAVFEEITKHLSEEMSSAFKDIVVEKINLTDQDEGDRNEI